MLEQYFNKPETLDQIHQSWLGEPICRYVVWLHEQKYSARTIQRSVPVLVHLSEYAQARGVNAWDELPSHLESFINYVLQLHADDHPKRNTQERKRFISNIVRTFLSVLLPNYSRKECRQWAVPFANLAPGFFDYLVQERGLSPYTINLFLHNLRKLETYMHRIELERLDMLTPAVISGFMVDSSQTYCKKSLRALATNLRVFLRYLQREKIIARDLGSVVEAPVHYRLAEIPRALPWAEVGRLLDHVDRRNSAGKRDYAILLLLITYGLRAREIAAMTLDDIDWERGHFRVPERKAGHSTAYPLSSVVAEAIIDYLQHARVQTHDRHVFLCLTPPYRPIYHAVISGLVARRFKASGLHVPRAGSHTLRHTCVQRLIDAHFDLKTVGDYVGHGAYASTEIYTKIDVEALREVALGDGEAIL